MLIGLFWLLNIDASLTNLMNKSVYLSSSIFESKIVIPIFPFLSVSKCKYGSSSFGALIYFDDSCMLTIILVSGLLIKGLFLL